MSLFEITEYLVLGTNGVIIDIFYTLDRAKRFVKNELDPCRASSIYNRTLGTRYILQSDNAWKVVHPASRSRRLKSPRKIHTLL